MTKTMKNLSIATVTAGMLVVSMTGAIAQEPASPSDPTAPAATPAPAPEEGATQPEAMGDKMKQKRKNMKGGSN